MNLLKIKNISLWHRLLKKYVIPLKEEVVCNIMIPKDLEIYGYEKQLESLFANLIKNSWEAKKKENNED